MRSVYKPETAGGVVIGEQFRVTAPTDGCAQRLLRIAGIEVILQFELEPGARCGMIFALVEHLTDRRVAHQGALAQAIGKGIRMNPYVVAVYAQSAGPAAYGFDAPVRECANAGVGSSNSCRRLAFSCMNAAFGSSAYSNKPRSPRSIMPYLISASKLMISFQ
jgi:hypothetical protein